MKRAYISIASGGERDSLERILKEFFQKYFPGIYGGMSQMSCFGRGNFKVWACPECHTNNIIWDYGVSSSDSILPDVASMEGAFCPHKLDELKIMGFGVSSNKEEDYYIILLKEKEAQAIFDLHKKGIEVGGV